MATKKRKAAARKQAGSDQAKPKALIQGASDPFFRGSDLEPVTTPARLLILIRELRNHFELRQRPTGTVQWGAKRPTRAELDADDHPEPPTARMTVDERVVAHLRTIPPEGEDARDVDHATGFATVHWECFPDRPVLIDVSQKPDDPHKVLKLLLDYVKRKMAKAPAVPLRHPDDPNVHSGDFRSVRWFGTSYSFTKNQAACVKVLWAAWEAGTPELDGLTVVVRAEVSQARLIDVFRSKGKPQPAWGTMIVKGKTKGAYRLSEPAAVAVTRPTPEPRRKKSRKTPRKTHR